MVALVQQLFKWQLKHLLHVVFREWTNVKPRAKVKSREEWAGTMIGVLLFAAQEIVGVAVMALGLVRERLGSR